MRLYSVGGLAYRSVLHVTHVMGIASLISASYSIAMEHGEQSALRWSGVLDYQHASDLWRARAQWVNRAMARTDEHYAVCVDSDVQIDGAMLSSAMLTMDDDVAIGVVPVRVDDEGRQALNLWQWTEEVMTTRIAQDDWRCDGVPPRITRMGYSDLSRWRGRAVQCPYDIAAGGWGAVALNLPWWRRNWPHVMPECPPSESSPARGMLLTLYSEDIAMCMGAQWRGGRVVALPVSSAHAVSAPHSLPYGHAL